jgi:hypothetical protein
MKTVFLILVLLLLIAGLCKVSYHKGFQDGWVGNSVDYSALVMYHNTLSKLDSENNFVVQYFVWEATKRQARKMELEWKALSLWDQLQYPSSAFWKQDVGPPRHLQITPEEPQEQPKPQQRPQL